VSKLKAIIEAAKRAGIDKSQPPPQMPDEAARQGIRGYHGSPYNFPPVRELEMPDGAVVYQSMDDAVPEGARVIKEHPLGRFDMSKIGTGEGAQAYGRGLYFAQAEDVGKGYRDQLSEGLGTVDGESIGGWAAEILDNSKGDPSALRARINMAPDDFWVMNFEEGIAAKDNLLGVVDRLESGVSTWRPGGHMYEVDIDATPDDFLDYDKPLSEQSEKVRKAIKSALESKGFSESQIEKFVARDVDGQELNAALSTFDEAAGANRMLSQGIKGIKYLDQGSRAAGKGTSNYVVFDDKLIDIIKKYGVSVPIAVYIAEGIITPEEAQAGFIGPTSKIFINEAANLAKSMDAAGNTRDEIWKATGEQFGAPMLKGPEGVWKQEISDQGNYIPAEQEAGLRQGRTPTFGAALQGPDGPSSMVEAYPRLQDSRITPIVSDTTRGSFDPRSGDIRLSTGDSLVNRSNQEMASTLQHEGQHFIQEQENWAKGGNPEHSARMLDAAKRDLVEAQEKEQSVRMQYEDKLEELGYRNAIDLSRTAYKLSEVDRLKGYLDGYYNGGKLTDKRRHILNSGGIMDPNAEYRMRRGINWAKRHRPQAERDQNYADYIQGVIAAVEKDMDPQLVEQVRNSGVKNPYAKYQREISNARAKAYEALGAEMETWNGTVRELNQFVNRYVYGGYKTPRKDLYRELAGEVEARTVQERLPMSMDERVASPPWEGKEWTETPPENQVFIDDYGRLATATMGGALAALAGSANASGGGLGSLPAATKKAMAESVKQAKEQGLASNPFATGITGLGAMAALPSEEAQAGPLSAAGRAAQKGFTKDVYHGTTQDFDQVDPDAVDLGIHVGTPAQAANRLRDTTGNRFSGSYDEGANIMPLKARMNNTLEMEDAGDWKDSYQVLGSLRNTPVGRKNRAKIQEMEEQADEIMGQYAYGDEEWRDSPENRELLDEINTMLADAGYDSIRYSNQVENTYGSSAGLTPQAEQRKAAISKEINALDRKLYARKPDMPAMDDPDLAAKMDAFLSFDANKERTPADAARRQQLLDENMAISADPANQADTNSYIILDPDANLRSRNAQFMDERGNLLASVGTGLGLGVGAAFAPEKAQASEYPSLGGMGVTSRAMPDEVAFKAPREPRRIPEKQPPGIASLAGQLGLGAMSEIAGAILGGLSGAAEYGRGSGPSMGGMAGAPATAESIRNINEGVSGYVGDLYDAGPEAQALGQQIMQGIGETIAPIAEYAMEGPITDEYGINMLPLIAQKLGIPLYELLERVYSMMPELEQEALKSGADAFL
jgi:hypothetical protein